MQFEEIYLKKDKKTVLKSAKYIASYIFFFSKLNVAIVNQSKAILL